MQRLEKRTKPGRVCADDFAAARAMLEADPDLETARVGVITITHHDLARAQQTAAEREKAILSGEVRTDDL